MLSISTNILINIKRNNFYSCICFFNPYETVSHILHAFYFNTYERLSHVLMGFVVHILTMHHISKT